VTFSSLRKPAPNLKLASPTATMMKGAGSARDRAVRDMKEQKDKQLEAMDESFESHRAWLYRSLRDISNTAGRGSAKAKTGGRKQHGAEDAQDASPAGSTNAPEPEQHDAERATKHEEPKESVLQQQEEEEEEEEEPFAEEEQEAPHIPSIEDLGTLKVKELQKELKDRGFPPKETKKRKAQLIAMLHQWYKDAAAAAVAEQAAAKGPAATQAPDDDDQQMDLEPPEPAPVERAGAESLREDAEAAEQAAAAEAAEAAEAEAAARKAAEEDAACKAAEERAVAAAAEAAEAEAAAAAEAEAARLLEEEKTRNEEEQAELQRQQKEEAAAAEEEREAALLAAKARELEEEEEEKEKRKAAEVAAAQAARKAAEDEQFRLEEQAAAEEAQAEAQAKAAKDAAAVAASAALGAASAARKAARVSSAAIVQAGEVAKERAKKDDIKARAAKIREERRQAAKERQAAKGRAESPPTELNSAGAITNAAKPDTARPSPVPAAAASPVAASADESKTPVAAQPAVTTAPVAPAPAPAVNAGVPAPPEEGGEREEECDEDEDDDDMACSSSAPAPEASPAVPGTADRAGPAVVAKSATAPDHGEMAGAVPADQPMPDVASIVKEEKPVPPTAAAQPPVAPAPCPVRTPVVASSPAPAQQGQSKLQSGYAMTPDKASDDDDAESDDEGKATTVNGKLIPHWAQKDQLASIQEFRDPDPIFGLVETCDLSGKFDAIDVYGCAALLTDKLTPRSRRAPLQPAPSAAYNSNFRREEEKARAQGDGQLGE
jgi:hypothetical protein